MANTTRQVMKRRRVHKKMPTIHELDKLRVVLTADARQVFRDESDITPAIRSALSDGGTLLPEEIVLWRGNGEDRVVALINRHVRAIYVERLGMPGVDPRRDVAIRTVDLGIGSRPDLPSGVEYVRRVRGVWKGLLPK